MSERTQRKDDRLLALLTGTLAVTGILVIYDASFPTKSSLPALKQSASLVIGLIAYAVARRVHPRLLYALAPLLAAIVIPLMIAVRTVGVERHGAHRWLKLGQFGSAEFFLQPAELGKVVLILLLARLLCSSSLRDACSAIRAQRWPVLAISVVFAMAGIVVVRQDDLGSAVVLVGIGLGMLFIAGLPMRRLVALVMLVAALGTWFTLQKDYRVQRVMAFQNPFATIDTSGYQLAHSLMGIGTGGVWGTGLGLGRAKEFLPAASTDFVFTTVAEETGLWGSTIIIVLLALVALRILQIAYKAQAMYLILLAGGIGIMIALQSLLNLCVVLGMAPTTGLPLPFISYGGSSLVTVLLSIGIVQQVARHPVIDRIGKEESHARSSSGGRNRWTPVPRREHRRGVA